MQKRFEFMEWATADVVFKAYGRDLNELFANAALAFFEVMIDTNGVKQKIKKEISVQGEDLPSLMVAWLTELLYWVDAESLFFSRFDVKIDEKTLKLTATVWGEELDPERHSTREDIKAVTYHKMEIAQQPDGSWYAQIIVDI
jgi:SHS2 domain-containing protein